MGGPNHRFIVKDVSVHCYGPSNWVWLRLEIKQNHWSILKKVVFCTNLEQMFKFTATDLDTQPTTMQQRLMCSLKNARLLSDGCCCLNDKGNEILCRINTSPPLTTIAGLDRVGQCLGLPGHWTSHQWTSSCGGHIKALIYTSPVDSEKDLIAHIVEAAATIRQATWHFWVHMSVAAALLSAVYQAPNWYEIRLFFRLLQWLCLISNLSQTQLDGP